MGAAAGCQCSTVESDEPATLKSAKGHPRTQEQQDQIDRLANVGLDEQKAIFLLEENDWRLDVVLQRLERNAKLKEENESSDVILTSDQVRKIKEFKNKKGIQDDDRAEELLERVGWNLEKALKTINENKELDDSSDIEPTPLGGETAGFAKTPREIKKQQEQKGKLIIKIEQSSDNKDKEEEVDQLREEMEDEIEKMKEKEKEEGMAGGEIKENLRSLETPINMELPKIMLIEEENEEEIITNDIQLKPEDEVVQKKRFARSTSKSEERELISEGRDKQKIFQRQLSGPIDMENRLELMKSSSKRAPEVKPMLPLLDESPQVEDLELLEKEMNFEQLETQIGGEEILPEENEEFLLLDEENEKFSLKDDNLGEEEPNDGIHKDVQEEAGGAKIELSEEELKKQKLSMGGEEIDEADLEDETITETDGDLPKSHKASVSENLHLITKLCDVCERGDTRELELMLQEDCFLKEVNCADESDWTAIQVSASYGQLECIKILVKYDADLNVSQEDGSSPLHIACEYGHPNCVKYLLNNNCDVDIIDADQSIPLHTAAQNGQTEIVEMLLDHGTNMNKQDVDGMTPLYASAQSGKLSCLQTLVDRNADITIPDNDGATALYVATEENHLKCLKYLVKAKGDINYTFKEGFTPFLIAAQEGHRKCLAYLFKQGADIDGLTAKNRSPCHLVSYHGNFECLLWLLKNDADYEIEDEEGDTPLDDAIEQDQAECAALLQNWPWMGYYVKQGFSPAILIKLTHCGYESVHEIVNLKKKKRNRLIKKLCETAEERDELRKILDRLKSEHTFSSHNLLDVANAQEKLQATGNSVLDLDHNELLEIADFEKKRIIRTTPKNSSAFDEISTPTRSLPTSPKLTMEEENDSSVKRKPTNESSILEKRRLSTMDSSPSMMPSSVFLQDIEIGAVVRIQKINDPNFDLIGTIINLNTPRRNYHQIRLENGNVQPYSETNFVVETIIMKGDNQPQKKNVSYEIGMNVCIKKSGDVYNNFYGEIVTLNKPKKNKHEIRLKKWTSEIIS